MPAFDDDTPYHAAPAFVHVGRDFTFEVSAIWRGIQTAEDAGISLAGIEAALIYNWSATVTALAFENIAVLLTLITEAQP